ncbi:hypothetical protein [Brevibacillus sp. NRS-1366]|uniref:hypothetical protein n=1 Tax=Brevibacillus sp. NRS-1366 TaxID=3233899 RepID=UPI003D1CFE44
MEKRSRFLGHLQGGITGRLHSKSETASKVAGSWRFSEVDAKSVFRFFHSALVGVPKILRLFLHFPLTGFGF